MPSLLLSGFEPFAGAAINESWQAVRLAERQLREEKYEVASVLLPVQFGRAGRLLLDAVRREHPDVVVATGLAAGRDAITPERVAINVRDARIPDAVGAAPVDEPCVPGWGVGWFSTLPIKAMVTAAQLAGVPAHVSQTAGTYVCNDVFAQLMHALSTEPDLAGVRGGFVHVPAADAVSVAASGRALALMAAIALTHIEDDAVTGGAEH